MSATVINVVKVSKHFDVDRPLARILAAPFAAAEKLCALDNISFELKEGEILGVVGPNGAGKTTLLRILAGLLEADSGGISLCDTELRDGPDDLRGLIGYVSSDERSFFWRLTGEENLDFFARLYRVPPCEIRKRIEGFLVQLELKGKASQLFRDYSAGTRKKFSLIRAFLHAPTVMLLDEVTNSLDPPSAKKVKLIVKKYVSDNPGSAVIWSTHRLEEITEICDRVLMLRKGRMTFFDSAKEWNYEFTSDEDSTDDDYAD